MKLAGHLVTEDLTHCGTKTVPDGDDGSREIDLIQFRQTVHGLLPPWIAFCWWFAPERAADRNDFWVDLLFERRTLSRVPTDGSIQSDRGDLIFVSGIQETNPENYIAIDLAKVFLEKQLDVRAAVEHAAVDDSDPRVRAIALRLLLATFREDEGTARAIEAAATSTFAELQALSAVAREDRPVLRSIANDPRVVDRARVEAVRGMITHRDDAGLLSLRSFVPDLVIADYLETIKGIRDPRGEVIARAYLQSANRSAAIDALAVLGTRETVPFLRSLLQERVTDEERVGIEVAIELIQERILDASGADHGSLSLTNRVEGEGALSDPTQEQGRLSDPHE